MGLSSGDNPVFGKITATVSPVQLPNKPCIQITLLVDANSPEDVFIGDASHQYMVLETGTTVPIIIPCSNTNQIWVSSSSGNGVITWFSVS